MLRLFAICSILALSGCAGSTPTPGQTSTSTSVQAETYNLARLSDLEDDMPPGFIPFPSEVRKLQHVLVAGVGSVVSNGKPYITVPSECSILLKPVNGEAGADSSGFRADGQDSRGISVGADMPVTVPAAIPATGCDRMTYRVEDDRRATTGTAERIAAPVVEGAATYALKITVDGFPDPEYFYAAILDDRVFVDVQARLAPDYAAEPLLPDLLVKAVTAIRGQ
jgi:hypothetical protein